MTWYQEGGSMITVCTSRMVGVVAALTLWVQLSLAHYSLYISKDHLWSYYSDSVHADLVRGQMVEIVRDGAAVLADDGSLLLSPAVGVGSGGSGSGHMLSERSVGQRLPPLPARVDMVDFTWVAATRVNYTLLTGQRGGQLSRPMFNVATTGQIPQSPETLQLTLPCNALYLKIGIVEVNMTTTASQPNSSLSVFFTLRKSCQDPEAEQPSLSTVFPQSATQQGPTSTPVLLSSPIPPTPSPSRPPPSSSVETPLLHSLPIPPTPTVPVSGLHPTPSLTFPPHSSYRDSSLHPLLPLPDTSSLHRLSSSPPSDLRTHPISPSPSSLSPLPSSFLPSPSPLSLSPSSSHFSPSLLSSSLSPSLSSSPLSLSPSLSSSPISLSPSLSSSPLSVSLSLPPSLPPSPSPPSSTLTSSVTSHSLFSPSTTLATISTSPQATPSPSTLLTLPPSTQGPQTSSSTLYSVSPLTSKSSLSTISSKQQPSSTQLTLLSSLPLSLTRSLAGGSMSFSTGVSAGDVTVATSSSLSQSPVLESRTGSTLQTVHDSSVQPSSSVIPTDDETAADSASVSRLLVFVCAPVAGILLACIVLSCIICVCIKYRSRGRKATHAFSDDPLDVVHMVPFSSVSPDEDLKKEPLPLLSLWMSLPWGVVSGLPRSLQTLVAQLGVDRKNLSINDTITRGEYGSVVSGQVNAVRADVLTGSKTVSIKMLTGFPEGTRRDEVVRFLEAATLMKGIQYVHILPVLHVSVEDNYVPLAVYRTVQHGDMYRVMKLAADPEHSVLPPLTTKLTLELAIQIANAMSYLADYGIIHPDLALRNCLLDSDCTVKVSDGALAQQFYPECYYTLFGATRPVRWAAVETLQEGLCTVRSNVWSYAVTVWEILTFAEMPYSEVNNNRSILSTIKMGARLPQPHTCPKPLYELLSNCWKDRGEERPNFATLLHHLQQLLLQYSDHLQDSRVGPQLQVHVSTPPGNDKHAFMSSIGMSVSRERLSHSGDSPRPRHHLTHRDTSQGSLKRISMASMLSRGSVTDKLSVTFSALSGDIGSNSEDETDLGAGELLQTSASQQQLHSILHQVNASFMDPTNEKNTPPSLPRTTDDDTCSSINTAILSDISSHTLVPPAVPSPARSIKSAGIDETTSMTSSNPISLTPPPSQAADTHSKTSTMDLESVSTAPYSSSPLHSTPFLYPGNGYGVGGSAERGDHSPLLVGQKARNTHSPSFLQSRPSAKSTDSGIRSDEDPDLIHSPTQYTPPAAAETGRGVSGGPQDVGDRDSTGLGISDLSSTLMAAFDTWGK